MADGTTKPIKDIKARDKVFAADPETGERGARVVQVVWKHEDTVLELVVGDGSTITTTEDHPFWNASDREWQQAQQLDPGEHLLAANGHPVRVTGLRMSTVRTAVAYNLTVEDIHTYYVLAGVAPVLVHNRMEFVELWRWRRGTGSIFRTVIGRVARWSTTSRVSNRGQVKFSNGISAPPLAGLVRRMGVKD